MAGDAEIDQLRASVSCQVLLERKGWTLDKRESSKQTQKYRQGAGQIVIVNHDGKGWWDPLSQAKGDVFKLAQHLDPSLNFGQVRRDLRQLIGLSPTYPVAERETARREPAMPPELRWTAHKPISKGSQTWNYLTQERGLTPEVVAAASQADVLREGPYASAWFAHRNGEGALTGIEMRGPNYRGFSADGEKTLFRLQLGSEAPTRVAVLEAPIKAMAFAAIEGMRKDTLYVATAGGMGPATIACLQEEMKAIAKRPGAVVIAAGDADAAGEKYAARVAELATAEGLTTKRAAPVGHKDWDDVLKARGTNPTGQQRPARSTALAVVLKTMQRPEPSTPPPWAPAPIAMAARVQAFEERDALRAAERMARAGQGRAAEPGSEPRRPTPGMGAQA